jgi:hypothetical protein
MGVAASRSDVGVPLYPDQAGFWRETTAFIQPGWQVQYRQQAEASERLRPYCRKSEKTGTISEAGCLYLRALCARFAPPVVVEVGTFIGSSALAMAHESGVVHTCDKDNDIVQSHGNVIAYGKKTSTQMFAELASAKVKASFFFFDGRIHENDLPLIDLIAEPGSIFAFDDFEGQEKGVINARRLGRHIQTAYRLVLPPKVVPMSSSRTTIAAMVPA